MALEIISGLKRIDGNPYAFAGRAKKPVNGWSKAMAATRKKIAEARKKKQRPATAEIPWTIHDLRRTVGTNMARLGIPKLTISRVLNHAEGGVTEIYARHSYLDQKRAALEQWAAKLQHPTRR